MLRNYYGPHPDRLANLCDQLGKNEAVDVNHVGAVGGNGLDELRRRGLG